MDTYKPHDIEPKWQQWWAKKKLYETKDAARGKENYMLLTEFPYPSGNLHLGHWYAFALPDIRARYLRMKGFNVLYPIGFDAFGLPAENAAIKRGINPREWTQQNIAYMSKQFASMGATFDWSRVVATIDPDYYAWTQWIFLKFYEKGLAYRAATKVNWCPKDKTVLANEQVVNGLCERCDTPVVQKEVTQWMFKITQYADALVDDLEKLDWPATTKRAQKNWIGRSEGATVTFSLTRIPGQADAKHAVAVFTTRPDTLFGVTAVVISPEVAKRWLEVGWQATDSVKEYVQASLKKRDLDRLEQAAEKTGVATGIFALHPITGTKIPVWVADYVLGHYGSGAVMMVPAHDERDFEFATQFKLPITPVIAAPKSHEAGKAWTGEGKLINSGDYSGITSEEARKKITDDLAQRGLAKNTKTYRLHDWVLSRQRYWGVPIPMVRCPICQYQPVPKKDLPVKLPPLDDFKPADDGRSPLAKADAWVRVTCPRCGGNAERETDTMDTFVDSSWYFMRYTDPENKKEFAAKAKMKKWLPVPMYVGGAEHNTMHLLYSRFFTKALHDLGYVEFAEPFTRRVNRGLILGPDGQKMSKSRGNVIDPDAEVARFGADTVRLYLAFMAPYEQGGPWDPKGIHGVHRFLQRVWKFVQRHSDAYLSVTSNEDILLALHRATKKIGEDIDGLQLNTGVSELMKLLNALEEIVTKSMKLKKEHYEVVIKLLAPFAPHMAEELWQGVLKHKKSVHGEAWPVYEEAVLARATVTIPVQVNGKVRAVLTLEPGLKQAHIERLARAQEAVKRYLAGVEVKRVVFVPDKLLNFVVA